MAELIQVKQQIKLWEHGFQKQHGRVPSKEDIKGDVDTYKLYRRYRSLKSGANVTPKKKPITNVNINLESDVEPEDSPTKPAVLLATAELGPTPQANGKVLSIFDIQASMTPPDSSPMKSKPVLNQPDIPHIQPPALLPFKTPTRALKRLDFLTPSRSVRSGGTSLLAQLSSVAGSPSKTLSTPNKPVIDSSMIRGMETPLYISKHNNKFQFSTTEIASPFHDNSSTVVMSAPTTPTRNSSSTSSSSVTTFQVSPSPLKVHRFLSFGGNKQMSTLFKDYQQIKSEKLEGDEDVPKNKVEEEVVHEDGESDIESTNSTVSKLSRKRKGTQKRTTRNWKMKPRVDLTTLVDGMESKNVHEELRRINEGDISEEDEESEEENSDDELLRQQEEAQLAANTKQSRTMVKPISQNYQRLKINDPRTKAFKRRMKR